MQDGRTSGGDVLEDLLGGGRELLVAVGQLVVPAARRPEAPDEHVGVHLGWW